jgi:uncharacterized membrane protein
MIPDLLLMLAVLVAVTALAAVLGAANLGTALSFGVIALAVAGVWIILRRP